MEFSDNALEKYGLTQELVLALFHGLRVGLYIVDGAGKILMVNPYAEQLLSRPAGELIGADSHDLLHRNPDGSRIPRATCRHLAAITSGSSVRTDETWFACGDGRLIPTGVMVASLRLGDGDTGGVVLFYDLLRHKAVEREQAAHLSVLRGLTDRLSLMAEISTVLTSTLEVEEALRRLTRLVVPRLADWAVVDLLGPNDRLRRVAVVSRHTRKAGEEGWERSLPLVEASGSPLVRVLRGATSLLLGARDLARVDETGLCGVQRSLFEEIDATSAVIAPLRTPRRVLGTLTLARSGPSPAYDEADRSLIDDIAGRAGLAVDNADLFEEQRRVAETMQRHLIAPLPEIEGLELAARYESAPRGSRVGGDWYDAFALPGGVTALVIGDVAGHDLQAAAKMSQIRNMLRMAAWARRTPPSRVVGQLDDALPHITDDLLATLVLALAEQRADGSWWLRWTSAGHPPPLLVDLDGASRYLEQGQGLLLGTGLPADRPDAAVPLSSRETILLYTDGLVETPGEPLQVGMNRLRRHAASLAGRPLPRLCDEILARMGHDTRDDIALLALRRTR